MFQFFPTPNLGRKAQLFEVWIRPVAPENAHFALRVALTELDKLIAQGLTREQFETTRDYLMKNVFVMTATQDQYLGYALDSQWYGTPDFTSMMRDGLDKLVSDAFSPIRYDADKPQALLDEDKAIGSTKLGIRPEAVTITPASAAFAK
jgi:zinc protease